EAIPHDPRVHPPRRPKLRCLFEQIAVRRKKERQPRRKRIDGQSGVHRPRHVLDRVGERERELLHRGRSRLANVVPGNRERMPLRHVLGAMYSLRMSFWLAPLTFVHATPRSPAPNQYLPRHVPANSLLVKDVTTL